MNARLPVPGLPLTPDHARLLDELVTDLTREEAWWISGYLASFASFGPQPATEPAAAREAVPLFILYASETGHGEGLAREMAAAARGRGLEVHLEDLADFRPQDLAGVRHLALITSTHGDGDPPAGGIDFCEFLQGRRAPRLEGMAFAVLGLGDSSYDRFCQTAKDVDRRLEAQGARRLHARADCDVDYEAPAAAWRDAVLDAFARESGGAAVAAPVLLPAATPMAAKARHDAKHPFPATLLESIPLTGRGSDKETRHLELSLAGSGLAWAPGDSLGVMPENDPALVEEILELLGLKAEATVMVAGSDMPLALALARHYDLTTVTPHFLAGYGKRVGADLGPTGRQVIDVVARDPARGIAPRDFLALLRPLQPRLYSLASSALAYPDEAHLTVAVVRYAHNGRDRKGVASSFLAERRAVEDTVPVHVAANPNFRLPAEGATPLIMIGAGTGVAPFRAFLQEREAKGMPGRNWLFFGERRFRTDFLYQTEWQHWLKDGRLSRMDVAFSRDQADKVYVQHRLLERSREVHAWLEEGASVYVCGDAKALAPDVHAALVAIVARESGMGRDKAESYWKGLRKEKRYQRDVY